MPYLQYNYLQTFTALMQAKLRLLINVYQDKIINYFIWACCVILVTGYLLQAFGMASTFGSFQLAGTIITAGLFEMFGNIATLVDDFGGKQSIGFYLTLPVPAILIFTHLVLYYMIIGISLSLFLIPVGKMLLWSKFALAAISWFKLSIILVLANALFACTTLMVAGMVPEIGKIGNIWVRVIFPLWYLGGFQFSWYNTHQAIPALAYVMLVNPITYVMEATRAAILGQNGYMDFWICCAILCAATGCIGWLAYKNLKKRLDFV
jgi:ABC-type polysaccharide/polyol phosphate export permease